MINKARALKPEEMDKVGELSEKFYPNNVSPNFMNGFYCAYAITDENDRIVIAGGLRPSAEIILVADKDISKIKITKALLEAQKASLYIGHKFGLNELVAFVKDNDVFVRQLIKHGFYSRSNALAIKVPKWVNQSETTS
jgi:hypothetical protein